MPPEPVKVPALRVRQWLRGWNDVDFAERDHRRKPAPEFYLLSLEVGLIRRLTGVYRREVTDGARVDSLGIQRRHDVERSSEIADYVKLGFPWSNLPPRRRASDEFHDLKKPGWLPTAVVVNMLLSVDKRGGRRVAPSEVIKVTDDDRGTAEVELPPGSADPRWRPAEVPPLEIIDGQHRLWAFDERGLPETYQLPVVAFRGLDISWQAYLFYTINIKPKRINRSLAFDLYPLLRTEDWLDRFEGAGIYRETRAQEMTEILWTHPASIWKNRINMLGEPSKPGVTQASWIRSLLSSFIRNWEGRGKLVGGLYGAPVGSDRLALPWSRAQQAAFLILAWEMFARSVASRNLEWVRQLDGRGTGAIFTNNSLTSSDQGVRVILQVYNDLTYLAAHRLNLFGWELDRASDLVDTKDVTDAIREARLQPFAGFLERVSAHLAAFDWRSSAAPGLSEEDQQLRMAYRGNGGYPLLRRIVMRHMTSSPDQEIALLSEQVVSALGLR